MRAPGRIKSTLEQLIPSQRSGWRLRENVYTGVERQQKTRLCICCHRGYRPMSASESEESQSQDCKNQSSYGFFGYVATLPESTQLLIYAAGVFTFYLIFGYTQEWLFSTPEFKPYGWYVTLIQFLQYSTFALLENSISERKLKLPDTKPPYYWFALIGLFNVTTIGFQIPH